MTYWKPLTGAARWLGVTAALFGLAGCPKKPGQPDAGADAAATSASVAPEAAPPAVIAANEAEVTRYPDQHPDGQEPLKARWTTSARSEAGATSGKVVAMLKIGTEGQRLADHDGFDLVLFADPSDSARKIEGWVTQSALVETPIPKGDR